MSAETNAARAAEIADQQWLDTFQKSKLRKAITAALDEAEARGIERAAQVFDAEAAYMIENGMDLAAGIFEQHASLVRALLDTRSPAAQPATPADGRGG